MAAPLIAPSILSADFARLGEEIRARQAELYDAVVSDGDLGETAEADAEEIPTA